MTRPNPATSATGLRMLGAGRVQPHPCDRGASDDCIATHPSDMAVAMRALDANGRDDPAGRQGGVIPIAELHRLPGSTPQIETVLKPGADDHSRDAAAAAEGRAYLSQGSRPRLLRLCAGLRRRRGRCGRRQDPVGANGFRRTCAQAVARRRRPRSALVARRAVERRASTRPASEVLAGARGYGDNDFKIRLAQRTLTAVLVRNPRGLRTHA